MRSKRRRKRNISNFQMLVCPYKNNDENQNQFILPPRQGMRRICAELKLQLFMPLFTAGHQERSRNVRGTFQECHRKNAHAKSHECFRNTSPGPALPGPLQAVLRLLLHPKTAAERL